MRFQFPCLQVGAAGTPALVAGALGILDFALVLDSATGAGAGGELHRATLDGYRNRIAPLQAAQSGGDGATLLALDSWNDPVDREFNAVIRQQITDGLSPCLNFDGVPA